MKKLFYLLIIYLTFNFQFSQQQTKFTEFPHIPLSHYHDSTNCFGYAIGRAFAPHKNECNYEMIYFDKIDTTYFKKIAEFNSESEIDYTLIETGDIIDWGNSHAAFVASGGSNVNLVRIDQVEQTNGDLNENLTLYQVIHGVQSYFGSYVKARGAEYMTLWRLKKNIHVIVENKFADGKVGGTVYVNNEEKPSPHEYDSEWGKAIYLYANMDGENFQGKIRDFTEWSIDNEFLANTLRTSRRIHDEDKLEEYNAEYASYSTISITSEDQNAVVKIGGIQKQLPQNLVLEDASILKIQALQYEDRKVNFVPDNYTTEQEITITEDRTINISYTGTPLTYQMDIMCTSGYMEPIKLEWNKHPHPDVDKYYIYRKYTHNGSTTKIATLDRGTTSYTDPQFTRTSSDMGDQLWYYIQVRYAPDNSYSDMYESDFMWGTIFLKETDENGLPTEYSITNFPNPFNPSTIIRYGLKEKGNVTIKVYNALGKEVKTFNEGIKERGYYHIRFNASHLASGIYYYRIMTNNYVDTKKMMLIK